MVSATTSICLLNVPASYWWDSLAMFLQLIVLQILRRKVSVPRVFLKRITNTLTVKYTDAIRGLDVVPYFHSRAFSPLCLDKKLVTVKQ